VQIAWDSLIRPDGYRLELGGVNGVDKRGAAGSEARYHENWFEYLKAAGLITLFSVANAKVTEEANKYGSNDAAAFAAAQANAQFMNQTTSSILGRVLNIQPTLTIEQGSVINVMLAKELYLPPVPEKPVKSKYTLGR
jgi:type IV secretion system protein VirB10